MYIVQNSWTGEVFIASASEARMFAEMNNLCLYNVYLCGGGGTPLIPQEIV